ncbi:RNA polymerase factor sigma-54 [Kordiimonas sp. SCSIO 12610]|uniref:RNA polymerase factor sigma-54 n=1 Tax=Kordiimonas sp. SCSIO 12610 TaxID=2829597 RepID=UPI00210AE6C8|nr:RNA polymerase factor sigma-54 [Kordiimonas sp. SCSIO 12610]UTW55531.1 RNA polymerase factor sigma-54 [Kordiimonas sp. SCSIO 12610]
MALTPRLDLRQSQQLVMTPQLQQAIKLLQLSNLELADYVAEEIERNPLLENAGESASLTEINPDNGEGGGTADDSYLREDGTGNDNNDGMIAADTSMNTAIDTTSGNDTALDTDYQDNVFNNDAVADKAGSISDTNASGSLSYDGSSQTSSSGSFNDDRSFEQTLEESENLHDFLTRQMTTLLKTQGDRMIAMHLIDMVDEAGYVDQENVYEIAPRLGCDQEDVEAVLVQLQKMEPSGVFARNLAECLAIQLAEQDRLDPIMQKFLANLDLLGKRDMAGLKKACGTDQEDLTDMIKEIRTLNPKPGLLYSSDSVQPVVPDIFISKNKAGAWIVELNTDTLPKVLLNSHYLAELEGVTGEKEAKTFVSDCVSNANWLVKALDQRAKTILKVATALVKKQEMFFEHGVRYMKPLILKDIAEEIDMHESTVSRVTNNKFMSCSRGMFELKYFFTSAISSASGGDAHSAESVKYRLKELIDQEDPKKILSDDKLVALMKAEGVDIARRTVAKYREAMKIPSSVQRRRQKNMA